MPKVSGLGDDLFVGGFHVGGDIRDVAVNGGPGLLDVTDITQSAHSRLGGLRDGKMALTSYHDPAAGQSHAAFKTLPTADVIVSYFRGQAIGNPAASLNAKQLNYDPTRAASGELTFKIDAEANAFGLEWGIQLTPGTRTDSSATTGAFFDNTAATSFGGQAYFHLTAFSGTSVTIDIQSATTSGGSYTSTGLTTTAMNAAGAQRLATAGNVTINEFLKVVTTGTFSNAVFAVVFVRNTIATVFLWLASSCSRSRSGCPRPLTRRTRSARRSQRTGTR